MVYKFKVSLFERVSYMISNSYKNFINKKQTKFRNSISRIKYIRFTSIDLNLKLFLNNDKYQVNI